VIARALAVWCLLLVLAVLNGGVRDTWLSPPLGDAIGRAVSSILLSLVILFATWLTIGWIGPTTAGQAMAVGALWVGLTLPSSSASGITGSERRGTSCLPTTICSADASGSWCCSPHWWRRC
jgi:hypothetical protein